MKNLLFRFLVIAVLITVSTSVFSQQKFTISGYIKDGSTGESLIGCTVGLPDLGQGTTTNEYGFFSVTVPQGEIHLRITYLGFQTLDSTINLSSDFRWNIDLKNAGATIKEVVVNAGDRKDENVQSSEMGKVELSMDKIKTLPALFGEVDILKTIQLLPGVQSGGEGNSGFYVRGGGPDQNLILLDEATVYNSGHLFGFFSVFNSDAINNTILYKGGMPANYGGRISSVLDIDMKEGNNKSFHASGGIGLIASRLTLEGPLLKNKSSFIISARRTYIDVLAKPFIKNPDAKGSGYYFYDLNTKVNYKFSDKDRLFLSGYFGRDVFGFKNTDFKISIPWGNATATARWNHLFSNKLFLNSSLIYNSYHFLIDISQSDFEVKLFSGIHDYNAKIEFEYMPAVTHQIQFGVDYVYHVFTPSTVSGKSGDVNFNATGILKKYGHEGAVYVLDKWTITDKMEVNAGLRFSMFDQVGPYKKNIYDFQGNISDSITYGKGEQIITYTGLEPRLLFRYSLNEKSSVKASFNMNHQYVHLVSNNGTTLPTDIWVPSSLLVKPQIGEQYSLGYFRNLKQNTFETSVEVYYKQMKNQIEYKEGYTPSPNEDLEESFVFGTGDSYGIEFFLNKQYGNLSGWIGYTLSYTNRKFAALNDGASFPYRYDRRHNLSVVASYKLNDHWSFGATFVYNTGIAYTLPIGKYIIDGQVITEYGPINSYRLADYHRLDISAIYTGRTDRKINSSWAISVYNVYNRHNPYFIYNEYSGVFLQDPEVVVTAKQVSLFPVLPSITWNFKF